MKKYITYEDGKPSIHETEIDKETESSVWIGGRRCSKCGNKHYHDSWNAAKLWLVSKAEKRATSARVAFDRALDELNRVRGIGV